MTDLIGMSGEELEEEYGFDSYLETKDDFLSGKKIDCGKLIGSFIDFNEERELKVIKLYDGVIQDIQDMGLAEIRENLMLLAENKGMFYDNSDDELATCYGFLSDDYFAEIMPGIIFFSGKEEYVKSFARTLKENGLECHEPEKISEIEKNIETTKKKPRKLGRNEPCHCGSGKKYKKCCLDKDVKELGKAIEIDSLWDEEYFAETCSPEQMKEKEKTIHMKHDEDMRFTCKQCNAKISAHNQDWHAGMCDACFNKKYHKNTEK